MRQHEILVWYERLLSSRSAVNIAAVVEDVEGPRSVDQTTCHAIGHQTALITDNLCERLEDTPLQNADSACSSHPESRPRGTKHFIENNHERRGPFPSL